MFILLGHQRVYDSEFDSKTLKNERKGGHKNVSTLKILSAKTCSLLYDKHRRYESFYMYFLEVSVYIKREKMG